MVKKDFPMVPSHWKNPVVYGKTKGKVSIRCDHWVIMTHLIDGCPRLPKVALMMIFPFFCHSSMEMAPFCHP